LDIAGHEIPLLLIAIMTMVLITSSGTRPGGELWLPRDRAKTTALMLATAALGVSLSACKPSSDQAHPS
jgi:cytochrome c oxidase subunit 3